MYSCSPILSASLGIFRRYKLLLLRVQIKGVENSSQQLSISFERNNSQSSSGIGAADHGGGVSQASPSLGFAYRRTPRSNAFIQPRGLGGGGGVAASGKNGGGNGGDGVHSNNGGMPPPSSSRLLSEGALTPSAKSGVLSPDVYLSGGVKRLNIPPDTEDRRQRFSSSRPMIKKSESAAANGVNGKTTGGGRRSLAANSGGDNGQISNGAGVEEAKDSGRNASAGGGTSASTPERGGSNAHSRSSNGNRTTRDSNSSVASPDGSARRRARGGGLVSPPHSTGVGTDVRAAAGGADESLLDASPAGSAGRLFAESNGDGGGSAAAAAVAPTLDVDVDGYETKPDISDLGAMDEEELKAVPGFTVKRAGFGSIAWKEPVDLRRVDIGRVVSVLVRLFLFLDVVLDVVLDLILVCLVPPLFPL